MVYVVIELYVLLLLVVYLYFGFMILCDVLIILVGLVWELYVDDCV